MSRTIFSEVRMRLLRSGIAIKYVNRAILELNCHFEESIDHAKQGGMTDEAAESAAAERVGNTEKLVSEFLARPELLCMTRRHPVLTHGLLPLMIMGLSCVFAIGASFTIGNLLNDLSSDTNRPVAARFKHALYSEFVTSSPHDSPHVGLKNNELSQDQEKNTSEPR